MNILDICFPIAGAFVVATAGFWLYFYIKLRKVGR